jgi:hypothetical protein
MYQNNLEMPYNVNHMILYIARENPFSSFFKASEKMSAYPMTLKNDLI